MIRNLYKIKQLIPFCRATAKLGAYYGLECETCENGFRDSAVSMRTNDPSEVWDLVAKLSEGGFSVIYEVKHLVTGKKAAAKVIVDHESNFELFVNEFEVLRKTNHKNIARLLEVFQFNCELWVSLRNY
jgi:serine/threonine protein kinase